MKKRINGAWQTKSPLKYGTATDTLTSFPATVIPDGTNASADILGNMVQSGTPTPDNVIIPSETGDRTSNLLDNSNIVQGGWAASAGTVPTENPSLIRCRYSYFFPVSSKNVLYDFKDIKANIVMMDSNGLSLGGSGFKTGSGSFTLLDNTEKISLIIANSDATDTITSSYVRSKNISLDYGYTLPIISGGITTPIYLGEVESTRRIKKLVLTGEENWNYITASYGYCYCFTNSTAPPINNSLCSHFKNSGYTGKSRSEGRESLGNGEFICVRTYYDIYFRYDSVSDINEFKTYLQQQYIAGTPVTVWYVLAEPTTTILNKPLRKIGDYADSVSVTNIPTTAGSQTFDVGTTLKPSEADLTYHGWHRRAGKEYSNGSWS